MEELDAVVIPIILNGYPDLPKRVDWKAKSKPLRIFNKEDIKQLERPDYVINFHWLVDRSKSFTEQIHYEINSNICKHSFFWDWLKEIQPKKFVNISTIKIFSELNDNPISSTTIPRPVTPYGISKVTAENYFSALFHKSSTKFVNLRLGSISSFGEVPTQLLTQLFNSVFYKKKITINKGHITNILYIEEAIDLIINSITLNDKENYLLVGDGILNEEISQIFEEIAPGKLNAEYIDLFPGTLDPIFISDRDKLKSSWTRNYSLESIIELIIKSNLRDSSPKAR